jgi:hypothetical protein
MSADVGVCLVAGLDAGEALRYTFRAHVLYVLRL